MAEGLVRSFGSSDSHREDEGFGLWREIDRVFDNLARSFGRDGGGSAPAQKGFAREVLASHQELPEVPLNLPSHQELPEIPLNRPAPPAQRSFSEPARRAPEPAQPTFAETPRASYVEA